MFATLSGTAVAVATLAVWRITHLLWGEDGPRDIFVRVRRGVGDGFVGKLLDCFYCLSLWIALPIAWVIADAWSERALLWIGLSGGAILLERATTRDPAPAIWRETPATSGGTNNEEEHNDVLLR